MRIQHNISALNAHRNLMGNNNTVSKNLEKLSSGYRINRAGDDAAGLAISEKMRAQITGLQTAQKNAEDGVSLVQTAEGALTEVHSMLNRMVELSTQSANGTYSEGNREEMQKEINALREEIDRISDTSNFNGTKLFQGNGGAGAAAGVPTIKGLELADVAATKYKADNKTAFADLQTGLTDKAEITLAVNYTDAKGKTNSVDVTLTYDLASNALIGADGTKYATIADTNTHKPKGTELSKAFVAAINKNATLNNVFKASDNSGKITFEAKTAGAQPKVNLLQLNADSKITDMSMDTPATAGADSFQEVEFGATGSYELNKVFTVGGKKFAFVENQDKALALGKDVNVVTVAADNPDNTEVQKMADLIEQKTGYKATVGNTKLQFKAPAGTAAGTAGGVSVDLHVGESSDEANTISVNIKAMSAKSLAVDAVDITSADGAKAAIDTVNAAIDTVSSIRSDLGALQNRLEHTINNIGVQTENITAAESRIRDVDMAKEMMAYTKNNILVQASQAMLAQANQQPQGVLQLLQ